MPRKRNSENKGLPTGWTIRHGAYYFNVPRGMESYWNDKKQFRLGLTLPEAYRTWSARMDARETARKVKDLLERYLLEVVPTKAKTTQDANALYARQLNSVFGDMPINAIKPRHIYLYVDKRSQKKPTESGRITGGRTTAHREIELLSHAYTKAVAWGYLDRHPFKGEVRLEGERPRDRYVEDWEVIECLSLTSKRKVGSILAIQAYIRIKLMTGMARSDLLRLTIADVKPDGLHIQRHKTKGTTGKRTVYEITPDLKRGIEMAIEARPRSSAFLFCNREGKPYFDESTGRADGWDSMWQRFMLRVLTETKVKAKFTEHDLRAKCASDAQTLEHARALLSHADARTTETIYRRRPERVLPLDSIG